MTKFNIENVNELDEDGLGLLHWASDRGNCDILDFLLALKKIDVNLCDSEGQTALHYASSCGNGHCVETLLKSGADINVTDNDGQNCIDVAFDENIKEILQKYRK
jgi:ankyrin repeat protein